MAMSAMARETIANLRQTIAGLEGRPAERLMPGEPSLPAGVVRRVEGAIDLLASGAVLLDRALGGGIQMEALTEIHSSETRNAASAAGFALALCSRLDLPGPVLWIGTSDIFHEAGLPYAAGIAGRFGIASERLLVGRGRRVEDVLWMADEAAGLPGLAAVVLELRGSPERLGLTATRRLQRRAQLAGRPVFLLRQAGIAQPTAAATRLLVGPAPALPRETMAGPLAGTIGHVAFSVTIAKSRLSPARLFTVEWKSHELSFADICDDARSQDPGALASQSRRPARPEAAAGAVVAFAAGGSPASRRQPIGSQYEADIGPRRAG